MNKKAMVEQISRDLCIKKQDVEKVLNTFFNSVAFCIKNEEKVQIIGFGTFEGKKRGARIVNNPHTGEKFEIPPAITPTFKPGQALKTYVNK